MERALGGLVTGCRLHASKHLSRSPARVSWDGSKALVNGHFRVIGRALGLSRAVMRNIRQNLFFAFVYYALGIPLPAGLLYPLTGWRVNPMVAGAAMALSSASVIGNAFA